MNARSKPTAKTLSESLQLSVIRSEHCNVAEIVLIRVDEVLNQAVYHLDFEHIEE